MRKILCILLSVMLITSLIVIVDAATNVIYSAPVTRVESDLSLWCWVASAEMVAKSHVPNSTITQSQAVNHVLGSVANVLGTLEQMRKATEYIANNSISCLKGNVLTKEATCRKLQSGYPIACEITISGNTNNHAVVIYSVTCNCQHTTGSYTKLSIYDPGQTFDQPYEYQYDIMYDDFVNGYYHSGYGKTLTWIKYVSKSGYAAGV